MNSPRLAKLAMAEAEGEDTEGKALVILVVLNRVQSEGFPDTVEDVILEGHRQLCQQIGIFGIVFRGLFGFRFRYQDVYFPA